MFETPDPLTVSDDSSLTVSGSGGFLRGWIHELWGQTPWPPVIPIVVFLDPRVSPNRHLNRFAVYAGLTDEDSLKSSESDEQ